MIQANSQRIGRRWFALLAGPIAWSIHLQTVYALCDFICHGGSPFWLHLAAGACMGLIGLGLWIGRGPDDALPERSNADSDSAGRLLDNLSKLGAILFGTVIFAQWIAVLLLNPCGNILR